MITMWVWSPWHGRSARLQKVDVIRETAKCVWMKQESGDRLERRVLKVTPRSRFFSTFDEAKNFAVTGLEVQLDFARDNVTRLELELDLAHAITEEGCDEYAMP